MSQTSKTSILAMPEAWNIVSEGYVETTMKLLSSYAQLALEKAGLNSDQDILDIACGPGTLSLLAAPLVQQVSAIDFSESMLSQFEKFIEEEDIKNIEYQRGDAQTLPYDDEDFDVAFSMFGLMFFPDRISAMQEALRCLKQNGKFIMTSWVPRAESPTFKLLMETMMAINPQMVEPPAITNPMEVPENIEQELLEAGFSKVNVERVSVNIPVNDPESFWEEMVKGNAPIALLKKSLPSREWKKKNKKAIAYLKKNLNVSEFQLDAWLTIAVK